MSATIRLEHGDCLEVIPRLVVEGIEVDSVVTDPPYHLVAMTKRFGANQAPAKTAVHRRFAKGFMGKVWDGGDVAYRPETWAAVSTILKPGGFLLVFGGTRTHHRVWCAIEDAGFVIQDTICWLYGSGFPKRRDMLKPAFEPICVAYRPGGRRELQIDECSIGSELRVNPPAATKRDVRIFESVGRIDAQPKERMGRWPANVCHDGSDEVTEAFAAFGELSSGYRPNCAGRRYGDDRQILGKGSSHIFNGGYNDSGSAARFFYSAKAGADDRWGSMHPTMKPVELMKWLVQLVTPRGGTTLDPFAGSGTTGIAARNVGRNSILIERDDEYVADIRRRMVYRVLPKRARSDSVVEERVPGRLF